MIDRLTLDDWRLTHWLIQWLIDWLIVDATYIDDIASVPDGALCLYECAECGKQFTAAEFASHTHDYGPPEGEGGEVGESPVIILRKESRRHNEGLMDDGRAFKCDTCLKDISAGLSLGERHLFLIPCQKLYRSKGEIL